MIVVVKCVIFGWQLFGQHIFGDNTCFELKPDRHLFYFILL